MKLNDGRKIFDTEVSKLWEKRGRFVMDNSENSVFWLRKLITLGIRFAMHHAIVDLIKLCFWIGFSNKEMILS